MTTHAGLPAEGAGAEGDAGDAVRMRAHNHRLPPPRRAARPARAGEPLPRRDERGRVDAAARRGAGRGA